MAGLQAVAEVRQRQFEQFEAYRRWETQQLSDPRFASVRMLTDDLRHHDRILPQTWERFDVEERTWAAEILNAPHSHIDRFSFDGRDIIVKESDGLNPRVTLRDVYQNGLDKTRQDVETEPGLAYQLQRDELFMEFYEDIEQMMRGETEYDTIHVMSTCPLPEELSENELEAERLMRLRWYDNERRKSFDYTARRLPNGQLELSATTLDSSNLDAHAKVLQATGFENVSFAFVKSHQYGAYRSHQNTTERPIESVIADRVRVYDAELEAQTGRRHKFGRVDDAVDAHVFFREYCEDYWTGYKAFHELLAKHLSGRELPEELKNYLLRSMERQELVGQSVLPGDKLERLRVQLQGGHVTSDMAMSCRELLIYDHQATLARLLRQYNETGRVDQLHFVDGSDFLDAYADTASDNGSAAAANGETFAGCETATSVNSLSTAAQTASERHISLEQALREQEEEAMHCLRIQLHGFTIRRGVHCPFCDQKVDARDTATTIECLGANCRTVLDKGSGRVTSRLEEELEEGAQEQVVAPVVRLRSGQHYSLGNETYRREQRTVVGGAKIFYIDPAGQRIDGVAAEELEALISQQILAETRAA